ncbi:hypothetical protein [Streptomyces sp. NPDC056661]|uniref:hypothetical protein n=1 Tax=Streptomyces sp. NPDC056661 TaxID=3345898 RepID=UPI0036D02287
MFDFPFVYLNHGPLDPAAFGKVETAWIAFREPISEAHLAFVARTCPEPISGFFHGDDGLLACESWGAVYNLTVAEGWGRGEHYVTEEAAAAFSAAVERWALEIHQRTPIAFFAGPGTTLAEDSWATWSRRQVGPVVVPWLERYLDTHPDLPQDDPGDAAAALADDAENWPATPMNRDTLSYLFEEFDADGDEGPPEYAQRLETLIVGCDPVRQAWPLRGRLALRHGHRSPGGSSSGLRHRIPSSI